MLALPAKDSVKQLTEDEMVKLLADYTKSATSLCNEMSMANWAVQTDVGNQTNEENQV